MLVTTQEDIAYQVCEYQILKTTPNSKVSPLILNNLRDKKLYWRGEDKLGSTEFTFSRFLIPELMDFGMRCFVIVTFYLLII